MIRKILFLLAMASGVVGVLLIEGVTSKSLLYVTLVMSVLMAVIVVSQRRQQRVITKLEQQWQEESAELKRERPPQEFIESMESAIGQLCELSSKQVELSRVQTEEAIKTLSKRFGGLVKNLTAAVEASKTTAGGMDGEDGHNIVAVFEGSRDKLTQLVDRMAQSTQMRDNLKIRCRSWWSIPAI